MIQDSTIKPQDVLLMWWYLRFVATPDGGWSWHKDDRDNKIPDYEDIEKNLRILIEKSDSGNVGQEEAGCDPRHEQVTFALKATQSKRAIWKKYLHDDVWLPKNSPKWNASKLDENLKPNEREAKRNGNILRERAKAKLKANFPQMFEDYAIPEAVPENLTKDTIEIIEKLAGNNSRKLKAANYLQKIIHNDLIQITKSPSDIRNHSTNNQAHSSPTAISEKEDAERSGFLEGSRKEYLHLKSERSPKVRLQKLKENKKKYNEKITCELCEMIPEEQYGKDCSEQVDVHHIEPLANADGQIITELKDLLVLCPNCHRFTHKMMATNKDKKKSFGIAELKKLLETS